MKPELLEQMVIEEIKGKNAAIHAYDRMMWTVRSGYLTLVFAGWGFTIKAAVEKALAIKTILPYIFLLSVFTIALAIGAFMTDRNYARRKFRVIVAQNNLVEYMLKKDLNNPKDQTDDNLVRLLQISGDADSKSYMIPAFMNEIFVIRVIYSVPPLLAVLVSLLCLIY